MVKFTGGKAKLRRREIETAERGDRPDGLMNAAPVSYPVAQTTITALQVYHNPERKPGEEGPWNDEADKVAWVDAGSATTIWRFRLAWEGGDRAGASKLLVRT